MIILNEQKLTEAFSPSMPDWLKDALLDRQSIRAQNDFSSDFKGDYKDSSNIRKNSVFTNPEYTGQRGTHVSGNLWSRCRALGINLESANFIRHDITGPKDPWLKEPYMPIFLLEFAEPRNGTLVKDVYWKYFNDNQIFYGEPVRGDYVAFKYVPNKILMNHMKDVVFLDMNDESNYSPNKRADRLTSRTVSPEHEIMVRHKNEAGKKGYYSWDPSYDKSGYRNDETVIRNKLNKLKGRLAAKQVNQLTKIFDGVPERLYEASNAVTEYQKNIVSFGVDTDSDTSSSWFDVRNAIDCLGNAFSRYRYAKTLLSNIEYILSEGKDGDDPIVMSYISDMKDKIKQVNGYIDTIKRYVTVSKYVDVDWD